MGAIFRWIKYIYEWCKAFVMGKLDAFLGGGLGYPVVYHVSKSGADTNNGLSWANAFLTVQHGLDAVGLLGLTNKGTVLVGPGEYIESLVTPLDTVARYGALIAVTQTERGMGTVELTSAAMDAPTINVRSRGWRISGFEINCPSAEAGIKLDQLTANCVAAFTQIDHCHFDGLKAAFGLRGIDGYGAASHARILDNLFTFLLEAGGVAIGSTDASWSNPNLWEILRNVFIANANHIDFRPNRGPGNATILENTLHKNTAVGPPVGEMINLAGGSVNIISKNVLGGDYSVAGGYTQGGATDEWFGNFADVAGGVTQDNPV